MLALATAVARKHIARADEAGRDRTERVRLPEFILDPDTEQALEDLRERQAIRRTDRQMHTSRRLLFFTLLSFSILGGWAISIPN